MRVERLYVREHPTKLQPLPTAGSPLDLAEKDLRGADLSNQNLSNADLRGAHLEGAILDGTELYGADLTDADLTGVHATGAGFGSANLRGAVFQGASLEGAVFTQADLRGASFQTASLAGARFVTADLRRADFARADLTDASLQDARLDHAGFRDANLENAVFTGAMGYTTVNWIGVNVLDANLHGAHLFRRHVMDALYLHEFRNQSQANRVIYALWWVTSDCGRSLLRWTTFTFLLAMFFAGVYSVLPIDFGDNETWLSPIYFSIVTLTTLGFGDALPTTVAGQVAVMAEVVTGYVMLGGLISILSDKMARRA